ncbi:universal stress protein [Halobacteriales archaeon QS_1_68_20]|nr:MAG: universal stress protein [Halobacteriales archaeon QS_1_68_20]
MYEVILFPTDGSDGATAALDHAIDQASKYGATLDVLHVGDPESDGDAVEAAAERARDAGLQVNTAVVQGTPHEVIADYVTDRGVDVVVMGSHGRRGLDRYLLGSVTERVLRTVDVPVLVVPMVDE